MTMTQFIVGGAILILIFSSGVELYNQSDLGSIIKNTPGNEIISYLASWVILLSLSFAASIQINEIFVLGKSELKRRRANQIAMMIALVLTVFLFKQSYLGLLFGDSDPSFEMRALLFGGGATSGWIVWYLKHLKRYGEFFHIFLLTSVVGFSWYARLTAPEEVQLTAVAFILGSLFKVAKDYMDDAARESDRP